MTQVYSTTRREQRCWVHKTANVLDNCPSRLQPTAEEALAVKSGCAETSNTPLEQAFDSFLEQPTERSIRKAVVECSPTDLDVLLAFYDFPAEHWIHLRTTNPIESTFATVRHRTKVTRGPGSRTAGLAMAFKLIEAAQDRWRAVNAPHLVALVRAGALFVNGKLVERPDETPQPEAA